ncbi:MULTISPECIES: DUF3247 family protein [Pseudoxanthomonas]|jgi:Protein of unknown function (DUF3247).|uniref:Uncharacterized protein DUF3247 n=1 Tax=Pseudoxanthomonas taiwanensis J19 TaxID=935569 RepID=A0A562D8B1_9GAMM|nr:MULTISPECIES: DUF3247 family protein [Pseudoxanthomonas]RRN79118.1 DUF3247 family protein [Pseudoxanthomonas sp. SGD-10]TWH05967.1 uncharacterized protein DUF3247 [Pseudoxanthomonas taiwanensis J19]
MNSIAIAPRVHSDPQAIERLKALQLELDGELEVEVHMRDGSILRGTLPERPAIQQFLDPDGNEGTNGLFRVDDGDGGMHLYWLDEVERVVRVGSS